RSTHASGGEAELRVGRDLPPGAGQLAKATHVRPRPNLTSTDQSGHGRSANLRNLLGLLSESAFSESSFGRPFTLRAVAGAIASVAQLAETGLRVNVGGRRESTRSRALRRGCAAGWR